MKQSGQMPCRVGMMLLNRADFRRFSSSDLLFSDAPRKMAFPTPPLWPRGVPEVLGFPVVVADREVLRVKGEGWRGEGRKRLERNGLLVVWSRRLAVLLFKGEWRGEE
jgi:hypothetical protein